MSTDADSLPSSPALGGSVTEILERVAVAIGAKNDAALARSLGVSRQTLSSWRKRGTVPHEAVAAFAADKGFSLDYLLLGKGPSRSYDGAIDLLLMEAIEMEIEGLIKDAGEASQWRKALMSAYNCSVVYNRIWRITKPGDNPYDLIPGEAKYLMELLARENAGGATMRVHPEIARHMEGLGIDLREVYIGGDVSKVVVDKAVSKSRKAVKGRGPPLKKR